MTAERKPRMQCAKCPWKTSTNPHDIPNGYSAELHADLVGTIADPGALSLDIGTLRIMACHESAIGRELPCVGWLMHQLGVGNNLPLRIAASSGRIDANVKTVGPQHECFEDTLPRRRRKTERRS